MVKLKALRTERGESREALAVAVGVSYSTIANLESGRTTPLLDVAVRIARHYGVSVESIEWGKPADADTDTTGKNHRAAVA